MKKHWNLTILGLIRKNISKEPIDLLSVNVDQIVVSDKFKYNNEGFKYFIDYLEGGIVKPLCIILPQMSRYIKYLEIGEKNMSFFIKDDEIWDKYDKIWDINKDKVGIEFYSEPVYEYKYLKAKVREFHGVIKTNFLGKDMPKENMHITCIACITIDSVLKIDKESHPQVYLEEGEKNTNEKIHKHWIKNKFRVIRFRFRVRKNRGKSW